MLFSNVVRSSFITLKLIFIVWLMVYIELGEWNFVSQFEFVDIYHVKRELSLSEVEEKIVERNWESKTSQVLRL